MPHVLLERPLHPEGRAILDARPDISVETWGGGAGFADRVPDADAVLLWLTPMDQALLDRSPRLKVVTRYGVGFDTVDIAACTARNIPVCVTNGANDQSVAEHALMLMLAVARQTVAFDRMVRANDWRNIEGPTMAELAGRSVLLLGYGRIGTRVARLCAAFGMRVMVHDPAFPTPRIAADGYIPAPDWRGALAQADILSLHCPLHGGTRAMIDASVFAAMKPGAWLINTARGGIVDEAALIASLRAGHLGAAGLDVLATEPPDPANPLLAMDNVTLSTHNAASAQETLAKMAVRGAHNILDALDGVIDPGFVVNPQVLRRNA